MRARKTTYWHMLYSGERSLLSLLVCLGVIDSVENTAFTVTVGTRCE